MRHFEDRDNQPSIDDYGVIGDCRSAALISRSGSLDWLCWPRFDSPAVFASILDRERGGFWSITPAGSFRSKRAYIENTNVLKTYFLTDGGEAVTTDLMPAFTERYKSTNLVAENEIIREVKCTSGSMEFTMWFEPRKHFGREAYKIRDQRLGYRIDAGRGVYWLRTTHRLPCDDARIIGTFRLRAGESAQFSLSYGQTSPVALPALGEELEERIRLSVEWWEDWSKQIRYTGPYREAVIRSALALKLMAFAPSGAIVAAPTTSLPETLGGSRNWDYRFCWLRDASLTIRALAGLGIWDEAEAFLDWMLHATRLTQPRLRILYTVYGLPPPVEHNLEYLAGFADSRPIRVGNAARDQQQLDIYGEVIEAAYIYANHGATFDRTTQKVLIGFGNYVAYHWAEADEGIWEPRSGRAHHTHSRLLCWVALDRLIKLAEAGKVRNAPVERFRRESQRITVDIKERAWSEKLNSYVNTIANPLPCALDASLLLISWYGFEPANSDRMQGTYRAICERLSPAPGLIYRYEADPPEGAFGVCDFWAAEFLAIGGGSLDQARSWFEQALAYGNDLGLFAEETDSQTGAALGNFPQAFTHIGLISAALAIDAHQREGMPKKPQDPHHELRMMKEVRA